MNEGGAELSTTAASAFPTMGIWDIAPDYSVTLFTIRHHGWATFRGGFSNVTGVFDADAGRLSGEVQVADIRTALDRLRNQVMTPEWFDPERFPTMSFTTNRVGARDGWLTAEGELTLHGVTKPVSASGTWQGPGPVVHHDGHVTHRLGIDLSTTIDRRDFGLTFNAEIGEGLLNLGWEVKVDAALQLVLREGGSGAPTA
jgi:polyisoprenoid-binding protein YceI